MSSVELNHLTFEPFLSNHKIAVVHFWAKWNGYDSEMTTFLNDRLPEELKATIAFGRLEIDPKEHWPICLRLRVFSVPFLALYRNGVLAGSIVGLLKAEILKRLSELIRPDSPE